MLCQGESSWQMGSPPFWSYALAPSLGLSSRQRWSFNDVEGRCAGVQSQGLQGSVESTLISAPWKRKVSTTSETEKQVPHLTKRTSAPAKKTTQFLEGLIVS